MVFSGGSARICGYWYLMTPKKCSRPGGWKSCAQAAASGEIHHVTNLCVKPVSLLMSSQRKMETVLVRRGLALAAADFSRSLSDEQ